MARKRINKSTKKAKPKNLFKPFVIKNYRFFPCVWSNSLEQGYLCYLIIKKHNRNFIIPEIQSPRFKTQEEAINFANNNKDTSFILG
jgi:hypothetical protein